METVQNARFTCPKQKQAECVIKTYPVLASYNGIIKFYPFKRFVKNIKFAELLALYKREYKKVIGKNIKMC